MHAAALHAKQDMAKRDGRKALARIAQALAPIRPSVDVRVIKSMYRFNGIIRFPTFGRSHGSQMGSKGTPSCKKSA